MNRLFPSTQEFINQHQQSFSVPSSFSTKFPLFSNEDECYDQSLKLEEKFDPNNPLQNNSLNQLTLLHSSSLSIHSNHTTHSSSASNLVKGSNKNSSLSSKSNQMLRKSLQKIKSSRF